LNLERIEITPFVVLVGEIVRDRRTGCLTVIRPPLRRVLYWSRGELVLITSPAPEDSLADFLARRNVITVDQAKQLAADDPTASVPKFQDSGLLDRSTRQSLLREWMLSLFVPLFSLDEGTAAFTEDEAIEPERRVFLQSTAAVVLEGIRAITNGLVLRRSLGDLKREVTASRDARFSIDNIALSEAERRIAATLKEPQSIESFLKQFAAESVMAAKVAIGMMALGIYKVVEWTTPGAQQAAIDDMQRDLELLAAIGSSDQRSLRAVALSRQLVTMDHYQFLDVPRAANRAQVKTASEGMKKRYDAASFPPIAREALATINRRIDEATLSLKDPARRAAYDKLLGQRGGHVDDQSMQQRVTQMAIAEQNFTKARELAVAGDYYGAIVLLKQSVSYEPDYADAWYLLGTCQERNPKWRRDAAESFSRVLAINPNHIDALISLGDLYKVEGLTSRAQTCYEDVLKIVPDHAEGKSRLGDLKKR
jgi:tetratricopeptide (TPR) repeat protein